MTECDAGLTVILNDNFIKLNSSTGPEILTGYRPSQIEKNIQMLLVGFHQLELQSQDKFQTSVILIVLFDYR